MNVWHAMLVLSWLAIAVLALALAGVVRQLRDLQESAGSGLGTGAARRVQTGALGAAGRDVLVLAVDPGCGSCREMLPVFARLAAERAGGGGPALVALSHTDGAEFGPAGAAVVTDPQAVTDLDLPWKPALALVDAGGRLVEARPVGSVASLEAAVAQLAPASASAPEEVSR